MNLKCNIKVLLAAKDMRSKQLAETLEVSTPTVSNWINGTSFPTLQMAFKIASVLDCKVDDLYNKQN